MSSPPKAVRQSFKRLRSPVRGSSNPEQQTNPFWQWCIQHRLSAYEINEACGGPDSTDAGPCWCFSRLGQPSISLSDGREVLIGGEHEDFYDPDFYIYNDVVVINGGSAEIYGYPTDVFPPTDFHSATLVGDAIFLIGNLGYPEDRDPKTTQVFRLNIRDWSIERIETFGELPGWLHDHEATYSQEENAIVVSGGKRCTDRIYENIDDYRLSLTDFTWFQLTDRQWGQWVLERVDGQQNNLWEIRTSSWNQAMGVSIEEHLAEVFPDEMQDMIDEFTPKAAAWQTEAVKELYQSLHEDLSAQEDEDIFGRYRLVVDGVAVRIDEDIDEITVTVEGQLPEPLVQVILSRLKDKLSALEETPYRVKRINP